MITVPAGVPPGTGSAAPRTRTGAVYPSTYALVANWSSAVGSGATTGTFEMTSYDWASLRNLYTPGNAARGTSGFLAVLTVLSLLYSYVVLIPRARE